MAQMEIVFRLRVIAASLLMSFAISFAAQATDDAAALAAMKAGGHVALIRHADAPGPPGDPPHFRIDDCATQRNLSERGRAEARAIGQELKSEGIRVSQLWSSPWCRCLETARLMDLGVAIRIEDAASNAFTQRERRAELTERMRVLIAEWREAGTLVVSTHGANILALTGISPRAGEIVVVDRLAQVVGRIAVPRG
jgi:broad specificity phosphatase PhoE